MLISDGGVGAKRVGVLMWSMIIRADWLANQFSKAVKVDDIGIGPIRGEVWLVIGVLK